MEEKKTIVPRRRMSPSLRKILLLLVLLLIPIFLAGAGFLVYSIINADVYKRQSAYISTLV